MRFPPKAETSKSFSNNADISSGTDDISKELKKAIKGASSRMELVISKIFNYA